MNKDKVTATTLIDMKKRGEKIVVLTAYDYSMAKILNEAGIDVILVGDSLGMVKLGYENTLPVTVDDICYHARAVKRGNSSALIVADMPFMSYEASPRDAVNRAGDLVKNGGAEAVKVEGGAEYADTVKAIIKAKIPVMGHIGLTPQAIHRMGGFKVQGRGEKAAQKLVADAKALAKAGVFAMVLEGLPEALAARITKSVPVPTIGIGAGAGCDGQVLVIDDILGIYSDFKPRFVKRYANLRPQILDAVKQYRREVKEGSFPDAEHVFK